MFWNGKTIIVFAKRKYTNSNRNLVLERKFGQHALCVYLIFQPFWLHYFSHSSPSLYTTQMHFNSRSIGSRQYKDINQLITNAEMKFTKKTDLIGFCGMGTSEATLIGLRWNLYHFEAKRKGYKIEEGHSVQFAVQLGQKISIPNQHRQNRFTNRILAQISQVRLPKSKSSDSKAIRKLRYKDTILKKTSTTKSEAFRIKLTNYRGNYQVRVETGQQG